MQVIKYLILLIVALMMTACASPKRGDVEYAPAMPVQNFGPVQHNDSIYQSGSAWLLHEDIRARHIGDMLTVTLQEKTDAEQKADTGTSKSTDNSISVPTIIGAPVTVNGNEIFDNRLASEHEFDGAGESSQSNSLTGSVTVTVVNVLANGNLVIQGEKWINVNQGEEYLRVRGIVRPSDINPDNSIASTRIANAQIQYSGDSVISDSNEPGWLSKFFSGPWMPF
jgi:flagellar L-ring protein precursor FlgH